MKSDQPERTTPDGLRIGARAGCRGLAGEPFFELDDWGAADARQGVHLIDPMQVMADTSRSSGYLVAPAAP